MLRRLPRCLVEPDGEDPVVARDAEEAEADDEETRDRAGREGDRSAGATPRFAASAVRTFALTATFMPMKPAAAESTAPIRKPKAVPQPRSFQKPMTRKRTMATTAIVVYCRRR